MEINKEKDWGILLLLCVFTGLLGAHRIYVGRKISGRILFAITICGFLINLVFSFKIIFIIAVIWVIWDFFMIIFGEFTDKDKNIINP